MIIGQEPIIIRIIRKNRSRRHQWRYVLFGRGGVKTEVLSVCVSFCVYGCGSEHMFVCAYKYFQYGWYAMAAPVVGDKAVVQERFGVRLVSSQTQ